MSKTMEIMLYQDANEARFCDLTLREQMAELCTLREDLAKAAIAHEMAKDRLKDSDAYAAERAAKNDVIMAEASVEATLRMLEKQQRELDFGRSPLKIAQDMRDNLAEKGMSMRMEVGNGLATSGAPEQVNTVTGEILPPDEDMEQGEMAVAQGMPADVPKRVFGDLDPAGHNGHSKPDFESWRQTSLGASA